MDLQRLLELCYVLGECKLLPAGKFRVWARANALRAIRELIADAEYEVSCGNTSTTARE